MSLFWSHLNVFEFADFSDLWQTLKDFSKDSRNTLDKSSNAFFIRRLLTESLGSLYEVFRSLLSKMVQILDMYFMCVFIYYILKSYRFNLMWFFCLLFKHKKFYFWSFLCFEAIWMFLNMQIFSDLSQTFEDFSEDSWKILRRLLGKSSNVFNPRRLPTKFSVSLLPKVVQRNDVEWSPSLSMLRNDI